MRRFYSVVIGLVGLTFGGASYANTIEVDNPLNLAPPDEDYEVTAFTDVDRDTPADIEGFWDDRYGVEDGYTNLNRPDFDKFVNLTLSDVKSTAWQSTEIGVSEKQEGDFLKAMVEFLQGENANIGDAINPRKINEEGNTFSTTREYFWIKEGAWTAYFRNPNPGQLVVIDVNEGGYSHYGVAGVPIPPAFLLFGSALLGMGWLARRQRARKDREAMAASHPVPAL